MTDQQTTPRFTLKHCQHLIKHFTKVLERKDLENRENAESWLKHFKEREKTCHD